ncbi:hypothetical protein LEP1GSC170_5356 [Leptospira interrogans serovar Bataviae str. HAI135]|nr:hypothetical protein LEP1GSC170_5356 [Leptospira interrogans serovar Bataviae str. HAI135]
MWGWLWLTMDRVLGGTQFYRGFVVIPTDLILRSKCLWCPLRQTHVQ